MISKIPQISINGSGGQNQRPLFNGYIYSLNYDISMGDSGPSVITVNLISEDGSYSIRKEDLNLKRVYNIKIGNKIKANMYLKRYKKIVSPGGNLLELEFIDGSFILDRTIVGLYKRYGVDDISQTQTFKIFGDRIDPKHLIIVGKEYSSCDSDYDGTYGLNEIIDVCHPCNQNATSDANLQLVNCEEERKYNILPVKYNFTELIGKIRNAGIKIKNVKDPNPTYFAEYDGTLRQVLNNWCSDFGWTFIWENDQIVFIDLRSVINVNAAIQDFCPNLQSYEEEYTLEGTVQTATITNYSRDGDSNRFVACDDAIYALIPTYNQFNAPTSNLQITNLVDEDAASLSYYGQELRQLYYYFNKYGIRSIEDIQPGKYLKELGLKFITNGIKLQNAPEPKEGDIPSVYDSSSRLESKFLQDYLNRNPDTTDAVDFLNADVSYNEYLQNVQDAILSDEIFMFCFKQLQPDYQWKVVEKINKKYFFVGYHNEEIESSSYQLERSFATGFKNRYNIFMPNMSDLAHQLFFEDYKFIEDDNSCNSRKKMKKDGRIDFRLNNDPNGAQLLYFNNPASDENGDIQSLRDLPFSNFLSIMRESKLDEPTLTEVRDFKLVCIQRNGGGYFPESGMTEPDDENNPPKHPINNAKFIRDANSYYPVKLESSTNEQGIDACRLILDAEGVTIPDEDRNRISIFMGTEVEKTEFTLNKSNGINPSIPIGIPFNGAPENPNNNPENPHTVVYKYPELKCLPVGNLSNTAVRLNFKTPSATFWLYEPANSPYGVVIEKTKQIKRDIPKIETIHVNTEPLADTVLNYDVNYRNISDSYIKVLTKENQLNTCLYDESIIKKIHEESIRNLSVTQKEPLLKTSFTVAGIDIDGINPTIEDGLMSVRITMDDNGVNTEYTFGTMMMVKPNKPEVYSDIEKNIKIDNSKSLVTSIERNPR